MSITRKCDFCNTIIDREIHKNDVVGYDTQFEIGENTVIRTFVYYTYVDSDGEVCTSPKEVDICIHCYRQKLLEAIQKSQVDI